MWVQQLLLSIAALTRFGCVQSAFNLGYVFDIAQSARKDLFSMDKSYYKQLPPHVMTSEDKSKHGIEKTAINVFFQLKPAINQGTTKVTPVKSVEKVKGATLNKHHQAINQIERSILEAGAMARERSQETARKVHLFKKSVEIAVKSGHYAFARQAYGHLIYHSAVLKQDRSRRRQRKQTSSSTRSAMDTIVNAIGRDRFAKMMALGGDVTLAFAFDTTYSMFDDIEGAKVIAKNIIDIKRNQEVDYILSPFSDPLSAFGDTQYFPVEQKAGMVTALSNLKAKGGGDCPELLMTGLRRIYLNSIKLGSPIYVFTDAGPKDYDELSLDELLEMAETFGNPINFLISQSSCITRDDYTKYESIANSTGGEILLFKDGSELGKISQYIDTSLMGGSSLLVVPADGNRRRVRRASAISKEYNITVDSTITTLTTSVGTVGKGSEVNLFRPDGSIEVTSKENVGTGVIHIVNKPPPGTWKLMISDVTKVNSVTAKGVSPENIDFDYTFIITVNMGRRGVVAIPSKHPVEGANNVPVVVTLSSADKVDHQSLHLSLLDRSFKELSTTKLDVQGSPALGKFQGTINIPKSNCLLVLNGKTKDGTKFKRRSKGFIDQTTLVLQVMKGRNGFTLERGNNRGTSLILAVHNFGGPEQCKLTVADSEGVVKGLIGNTLFVRKNGMAFAPVRFSAPPSAKQGSVMHVVFSVKGLRSGKKARLLVSLLVI